jgi:hypothetical protein
MVQSKLCSIITEFRQKRKTVCEVSKNPPGYRTDRTGVRFFEILWGSSGCVESKVSVRDRAILVDPTLRRRMTAALVLCVPHPHLQFI